MEDPQKVPPQVFPGATPEVPLRVSPEILLGLHPKVPYAPLEVPVAVSLKVSPNVALGVHPEVLLVGLPEVFLRFLLEVHPRISLRRFSGSSRTSCSESFFSCGVLLEVSSECLTEVRLGVPSEVLLRVLPQVFLIVPPQSFPGVTPEIPLGVAKFFFSRSSARSYSGSYTCISSIRSIWDTSGRSSKRHSSSSSRSFSRSSLRNTSDSSCRSFSANSSECRNEFPRVSLETDIF